ncbi:MAG: OB-fold nucleic acid binding domain-containing protein, partial [Desulfovibrio sp.]
MLRTLIRDALASEAPVADLTVCGWIRTRRDAKDVIFLEINDGSCLTNLQCVVDPDSPVREKLGGDGTGASLCVKGDLVASPGKGQRWELHAKTLRILGHADPETYPLQKKRHSDEFLRSIAHLRVRTNKYSS